MNFCGCTRSGTALFLVLWALLVVSVALIVAVRLVEFDLESESIAAKRFAARQLALSGIAIASHPQVEPRNEILRRDLDATQGWNVQILSENSRLNINRLLRRNETDPLRLLFSLWGLNERQIATIVDSLTDWTDEDELRGMNGAESVDIPLESGWSRPENRPFIDIAEMERVRGMEWVAEVKPDWRDFFSVHSGRRIDLQFAASDLIQAIGGIDPLRADGFVRIRDGEDGEQGTEDDVVFETFEDALNALGANPAESERMSAFFSIGASGLRRVESRGIVQGTTYTIECVLAPAEGGAGQILSWREF